MTAGRPYLAIPGPSVTPERVLLAMHRTSPDIYEGELLDLVAALRPRLSAVAGTRHPVAIYIGNGHAAWEAALANVASRGEAVLVPAAGRFGHGWATVARGLGLEARVIDAAPGRPFDPAAVEAALRADREGRIRAVLAVHTDTATSVRGDVAALRAAIDAAGHPALLMADCMASLGCDPYAMDAVGADVTLAGSQKGLMTPPGLAFLWVSDRAQARRGDLVTPYWDWRPRLAPAEFWQHWYGTAPVQHLYGLDAALGMIEAEGLPALWDRHARLARAVWAACEAWGSPRLLVPDAAHRSHAVTALGLPGADRLRAWLASEAGVTLGVGLGQDPAADHFRIGHMGHVNAHMVLGVLAAIETGMTALAMPHGRGALDAAAASLAG